MLSLNTAEWFCRTPRGLCGWDEVWDQGLEVDFIITKGSHLEICMMNKVCAVCVRLFHAQELCNQQR